MASLRDEGVCIRHWDWSETSQTVSVFTRGHGLLRGIAKGAKRQEAAFSGGLELLTRGEVIASVRPGRDLATLTAWDLREAFFGIRRSLGAFYAGMYLADLTQHILVEGDPHPALYDALVTGLRELEGQGRVGRVLLAYQWAVLAESGHAPELAADVGTGGVLPAGAAYGFSPRLGGVTADPGPRAAADVSGPLWRVRADTVHLLRRVAEREFPAEAGADLVDRANRLLASYLRELLGREPASMAAVLSPPGSRGV